MRTRSSVLLAVATFAFATEAAAAVVWTGDFETGDLSQFNFVLNGDVDGMIYAQAVQDMVLEGSYAARLELHNEAIWPNGLRRVELQHLPDPARTAEGATTCLGWSFYLPEALPDDPGHTLGYWESQNSYQQMMAFNVFDGTSLRFITQQPNYTEHWSADGVVTPNEWHRIAMCVLWSQDAGTGTVDVWFDGEQVVTGAGAKTLADGNPHFAQVGLLRGDQDIPTVPVIYLDHVLEGDSIEDVDPPEAPGGSDSGGGDTTSGGDTGGPTTGMPGGDDDPLPPDGTGGPGGDGGSNDGSATGVDMATGTGVASNGADGGDGDDGGCGCTQGRQAGPRPWWAVGLLALGLRRRKRRSRG